MDSLHPKTGEDGFEQMTKMSKMFKFSSEFVTQFPEFKIFLESKDNLKNRLEEQYNMNMSG